MKKHFIWIAAVAIALMSFLPSAALGKVTAPDTYRTGLNKEIIYFLSDNKVYYSQKFN